MVRKKYYENPPTAGLKTLWRDWLPKKHSLESRLSDILSLPPLTITCSGTIALVIALNTLKKKYPQKKHIIIPAYTCPLVALAIKHCDLKIVLCDLEKNSFDFDFNHLSSLLNEQILAIIPTHLGGRVADVRKVKNLASVYNISIIEDAAQALGAQVGTEGDIVFFSLAAGKGLTMYEGGVLTSQDHELRAELAKTANDIPHSFKWEFKRIIELAGYTALYNPFGLYFAYGMGKRKALKQNDLIDAVGDYFDFELPLHQTSKFRRNIAANSASRLPDFLVSTNEQAHRRIKQLLEIPNVDVIIDENDRKGTWPFIMVLLPSSKIRDDILQQLWPSCLGVSRLFIYSLPNYQYLNSIVPQIPMPNAEDFAQRMLTITNSLWLTNEEFDLICQIIHSNIVK